jgi:hypothetical protein
MQKLPKGRKRISVDETVLYLDDFLAVLQLFKDHCDSVKVTVEDYLLDDPGSEIAQLKDRLNRSEVFRLNIEGRDFYSTQELTDLLGKSGGGVDLKKVEELRSLKGPKYPAVAELWLDGGYGTLDYDADNLRAVGLSTCILQSLPYGKLRRSIRAHPLLYEFGGVLVFLPSFPLVRLIHGFGVLKNEPAIYFIPVVVGIGLLMILGLLMIFSPMWVFGNQRRPVLKLEKRGESRNFFRRKKDELLLILLSAIVGAGLTLLVQSLLRPPTQNITNPVSAPRK